MPSLSFRHFFPEATGCYLLLRVTCISPHDVNSAVAVAVAALAAALSGRELAASLS